MVKKSDLLIERNDLERSNRILIEEISLLRRELRNSQALLKKNKQAICSYNEQTVRIEALQKELHYLRDEDTSSASILEKVVQAAGPVIGSGSYDIVELIAHLRKSYDLFYSAKR